MKNVCRPGPALTSGKWIHRDPTSNPVPSAALGLVVEASIATRHLLHRISIHRRYKVHGADAGRFVKGNPEPVKELFSHRRDATLANPLVGLTAIGWERAAETMEHASSQLRDGEHVGFEIVARYAAPELAYVVEIERSRLKVGGREDTASSALRVTMIFRPEEGEWKVVHRHADPITTAQPVESVIQD
jgi:ketosteroid isomerase-like protein